MDYATKNELYSNAGGREYWIVDEIESIYYIVVFYFENALLYHEISIVRQKTNKNRKICDNISETLLVLIKRLEQNSADDD